MDWPPSLRFEFLGSLSTLHTSVFADGKSKPRVWRMMGRVAGTKMGSRQTALCREFLIRRHRLPLEGVPAWRSHCQRKLRVSMSPPAPPRRGEARRPLPGPQHVLSRGGLLELAPRRPLSEQNTKAAGRCLCRGFLPQAGLGKVGKPI